MAERAAVDASPLIFLASADLLRLLEPSAAEVVVPQSVADEILRRGPDDVTARAMRGAEWLQIVSDPAIPASVQRWDLGPGESAVLALALKRPETVAILDDLQARRCAAALNVPTKGTLGLVLSAKRRGDVSSARAVLGTLRRKGMYLSDDVVNAALLLVGE